MNIRGIVITSEKKQDELLDSLYERAVKGAKREFKLELDALADKLEKKNAEVKSLTKKNRDLATQVEVLEEDRDDAREVVTMKMKNDDMEALLAQTKELQDEREARLKDRESKLNSKEEGRYKEGYADGVADGVRKINEITAKDRENAMKVAMVAAASHSTPEVVKELTNVKSLGAGLED